MECYNTILSDLNSGLTVLFSGTPCQIAAVKSFINHHKGYPGKLITVEILCYGVPSPQIFKEHINYIESKENSKVIKYSFRDRRSSWGQTYKHSAVLKNGKDLYNDKYLLAYTSLFSKRLIFRESCFSCKFTSQKRCADITIGDCWGVQDIAPECFDANGVSQVWTNTEEGHQLWDKVKPRFNTKTSTVNKLIPRNSVLYKSAEKPVDYNKFWKYYDKKGYEYILKRYTRFGKLYFIRRAAQKLMEKMHIRD